MNLFRTARYILLALLVAHAANGATIFIFNPEGKIHEVQSVKSGMESFLSANGIHDKVYIFASPKDFQNAVDRLKPDIALVASYYYITMKNRYQWYQLLSGHYNNRPGFEKILVAKKNIGSAFQLRDKSIATVILGPSSIPFIENQFLRPIGLSAATVRLVSVSKDLDAIMALGFEQVDGAIVTLSSFNTMSGINPKTTGNLRIILKLPMIDYPKIAAFPSAKDAGKYRNVFLKLGSSDAYKPILRYFGVTGFQ